MFGAIGYLAHKTGYHVAAILTGCIIGPLLEQYLFRAMHTGEGDPMVLFSATIGNVLWTFLVFTLFAPYVIQFIHIRKTPPTALSSHKAA